METGANIPPAETFGPGRSIPDYTVGTPDKLNISSRSISASKPTKLSDILEPNMGACRVVICREHVNPRR
ncbi:hypothetical protein SMIR_36735 [Streptomyces mirabilis]|uniref:putative adhesin n=1 Tax=Streptomyces mirabilis TaxID=68239 RepID=UPI00143E493D|nr:MULTISPECIES: hypothetical protein [Streptomyces]QIY69205.1 hypothetical protein HEP84_08375 [Streptomyces sp. RLB1-33]QUW84014.1 hypothetical protein SMIR_36735 [Streptomyces mirabilis]